LFKDNKIKVMVLRRVVVTGLGALTLLEIMFRNIGTHLSAEAAILLRPTKFKTKFACELKNFNAEDFLDRKEARKMDRYAQYAMVSEEAINDAAFNFEN
jgi:3-oxoacyl-[acyl-carrier-protein] synthase II